MPRMSGGELTERVLELYPSIKIMFMTGYAEDTSALKKILAHDVNLLQKPFDHEVLAKAVRKVLDEKTKVQG